MFYEVMLGRGVGRLDGVLTYYFDDSLAAGTIVEVPIGRVTAPGVIIKKVAQPEFQCKEIIRILYSKPLPWHLVKAAKWMAEYYQAPLSACLGMMLPIGVLKKRRTKPNKTEQIDTTDGKVGEAFTACPSGTLRAALAKSSCPAGHTVNTSPASPIIHELIQLNGAQKNALEGLQKALEATKLLFGVTGSGKTNIYLKMALNALQDNKSTILLVPEIALTGQLVRVFREVFGDRVVLIHSKQTEVERHLIFEKILNSIEPLVVVGPRSALFAPLSDLGLIIIDEEHESTYYQENSPKYSAIRVASLIAKEAKCSCLLGSATPNISDYYLAEKKNSLITLTEKAKASAIKPHIEVVDFKNRDNFTKNRYFSNSLLTAIKTNLKNGQQTLIFHNRRGSAPLTICDNCGEEIVCPNCFLPLTLHADAYELVCHTCGFKERVPTKCPSCGAMGLIHKGFGTKLLENELMRLFSTAKIKRFDADTKKGEALEEIYDEVKGGGVDILVGTQTLAKGLDLPKLATVGVVQADAGLNLPDFAAEERTFQLLTQVIGRVGRGHTEKAEVVIQTFRPEHPVIKYAVAEDYLGFLNYALDKRRVASFPPFGFIARCEITMKTEQTVIKKVRAAVKKLSSSTGVAVSPPMPAFHEKTSRGYAWQIVVRAKSRKALIEALSGLDPNFRITLDPPSLL